ncbi:unnamed protein product [Psylliodes chrysocephalus]|uniref:Uncharacterized protein n=1 Tax=Psylliodes chrysocephalus TaxID=3402493 RepID=A0A9P0G8W0_9CUCU|nr:unnamed protein product [Psylliodes chrysocephala]
MFCIKCKFKETKEDQLVVYDKCMCKLCPSCSKLTTTEYRVATMKQARMLICFCSTCRPTIFLNPSDDDTKEEIKVMKDNIGTLTNSITKLSTNLITSLSNVKEGTTNNIEKIVSQYIKQEVEKLNKEIKNEFIQINSEVKTLRESNLDMVKLLTHAPSNTFKYNAAVKHNLTPLSSSPIQLTVPSTINNNNFSSNNTFKNSQKDIISISPTIETNDKNVQAQNTLLQLTTSNQQREKHSYMKKRSNQVGTCNTISDGDADGFEGIESKKKKIWLFISRVKKKVTTDKIVNYISKIANTDTKDIFVKTLDTQTQQISSSNSYMVGVDPSIYSTVNNTCFWPKGVSFERFDFRKGRRFLDNPRYRTAEA